MPQPSHAEQARPLELDPLLDFLSEQPSVAEPVERTEGLSPENAAQFAELFEPHKPVAREDTRDEAAEELRQRVERTERLLEQAVTELAAVRSDLATLVSTVDDIKKRQSRREVPVPPLPRQPARLSRTRLMMATVALAALATGIWGLATLASSEPAEPPALRTEPSEPVSAPPRVEAPAPTVEVLNAATAPAPAPAVPSVPRANPPPRNAPPAANYVGTLTVDASPAGEVFLNRKPVGHTPLRLEKLRAGSHLIWIQREGYRRWTRVVPVPAGRISRISASLDPIAR